MPLPPIVELICAAQRVAGLDCHQALASVPYSWLLRFRTMFWYLEGVGAKPRFPTGFSAVGNRTSAVNELMG